MLIVTLHSIPGYDVKVVLGVVMAAPVIDMAEARQTAMSSIFGGEPISSEVLRDRTLQRVIEDARQRGANAILDLRINSTGVYGTAAWVAPVSPEAVYQYDQMVQAGQLPPLS